MKLYIPEIGDNLTLKEDWVFNLHFERRNEDLAYYFHHYYSYAEGWVDDRTTK